MDQLTIFIQSLLEVTTANRLIGSHINKGQYITYSDLLIIIREAKELTDKKLNSDDEDQRHMMDDIDHY